jgi:hypothetical protein
MTYRLLGLVGPENGRRPGSGPRPGAVRGDDLAGVGNEPDFETRLYA